MCPCQTPAADSENTPEAEAITAPLPSEPPRVTAAPLGPYYNSTPCLPPYTAYELQVRLGANHWQHLMSDLTELFLTSSSPN